MLTNELRFLQELAEGYLHLAGRQLVSGDPQAMARQLAEEGARIKKSWSRLLFSQAKDDAIKRYIRLQHQTLLELSDEVYRFISYNRAGQTDEERHLRLLLEEALALNHFLVQYFNSYIDERIKIPAAAAPEARTKMRTAAGQAGAALQNARMDIRLKDCIMGYLNGIVTADDRSPLTYRFFNYLLAFTNAIGAALKFNDDRDATGIMVETLFYLNFNQNSFCQWYLKDVTAKKDLLSESEQLPMLKKQLLYLKTAPVALTKSYEPDIPAIQVLLENGLHEIIKQQPFSAHSEKYPAEKLELKLTVAQLALLIRLLYEEGVFAMKNISGLLRFFSRHFMSKKQEHISYGSMNKLYYSCDQFTGYAVRELLLGMVAKINKMFFPV